MPTTIPQFVKQRPYLFWDVKKSAPLSSAVVVEHVLNYGSWQDVQTVITTLGLKKTASLFRQTAAKPRQNYRPKIKHYFKLYFDYHAPRNS